MDKRFLSSDEKLLESGLFSDVTVRCGDRTWNLHKNILCSRSIWFEKALTGNFEEAKSGIVNIENFEPEAIDILIRYIYTGICDISALSPTTKTNFVSCFEVYTVGDYFALSSLTKIALDTLTTEFDSKVAPLQLNYDSGSPTSDGNGVSPDWLPELFEAIRLVYNEVPLSDTAHTTPRIRAAFLSFVHAARFYFLQNEHFNAFLDQVPALALDVFRAMRNTGDFIANLPDAHCSFCKSKPTRAEKGYYTHLATEKLKLTASCSTCAGKRDFSAGWTDWSGKVRAGKEKTEREKAATTATGTGSALG
ncbi:BTB/POZ protein [Neurospora tetraspora]|uniref:BTB/POZ protein n=1 Tax=Neurospora tetraspora TaxID=94610 RepID=A0AAE0JDQ2_9PEZI|nr:BTB/POZ protein [Neurospora tetraspora]